ncbi:MED31 [Bugula neritina]|uniref:Mediator of RNA polymerase II transcription subunit 31 n=1 Tax=Bugula neritina TaxID=10212 RepID=A0A7J7K6H8_BUGNE|nr:MED31 [Bugula neritina]
MASWQTQSSSGASHPRLTVTNIEKKAEEKLRFQIELEFVQSLANPHYLNFLAQRGTFKDSKFSTIFIIYSTGKNLNMPSV